MATVVNINGKLVKRPGVYTLVKSGIKNTSPALAAGNVLIIDDGIGAGFGGGAGNTVYSFDNVQDYLNFVKGGELWNLGAPLFKPLQGFNGVTKVFLIHARTTVAAVVSFTMTADDCEFTTLDQGLNANGVLDSVPELRKGYGVKIAEINAPTTVPTIAKNTTTLASSGVAQVDKVTVTNVHVGDLFTLGIGVNKVTVKATTTVAADVYALAVAAWNGNTALAAIATASNSTGVVLTATAQNTPFTTVVSVVRFGQFQFSFYHGTYGDIDPLNNTPYDGLTEANSAPVLLFQSPIVSTLDELAAWASSNSSFKGVFTANIGTGSIVSADVTNNPGYTLAAGGTETYGPTDWTAAKALAVNLDYNFALSMKYGNDDLLDDHNFELQELVVAGKYEKFLVIGGGAGKADFDAITVPAAKEYDDDNVILVHGDGKLTIRNSYKRVHSLYKAAACLGRLCGMDVQTPLTFKQIGIDAEWEVLSEDQLNDALTYGVLATYFDDELNYTVVLEDINTLQENENLVNEDASSFNIAVKRIEAQLNKELAIYLKKKFFGNQNAGPNRNTMTPDDVDAATEGLLQSRVASSQQDNYILRFQNIVTTIDQDNYYVSYEFVPNFEVSKIIVTGIILAS